MPISLTVRSPRPERLRDLPRATQPIVGRQDWHESIRFQLPSSGHPPSLPCHLWLQWRLKQGSPFASQREG